MYTLLGYLVLFFIVWLVYLHVFHQWKTSNNPDIYEVALDDIRKDRFESLLDLRQPVLCERLEAVFPVSILPSWQALSTQVPHDDVQVRSVRPVEVSQGAQPERYVPLAASAAVLLFQKDDTSDYFTERNTELLEESGIAALLRREDAFLAPPLVSQRCYDLLAGSAGTSTPFRYEVSYRTFFLVTQGSVTFRLASPKSSPHLRPQPNYIYWEFGCDAANSDPWKEKATAAEVRELVVPAGRMLSLPPYWWYSMRFPDAKATVFVLSYKTYMNQLVLAPASALYYLQNSQVIRDTYRRAPETKSSSSSSSYLHEEDMEKPTGSSNIITSTKAAEETRETTEGESEREGERNNEEGNNGEGNNEEGEAAAAEEEAAAAEETDNNNNDTQE
jgi:hypothetical protein